MNRDRFSKAGWLPQPNTNVLVVGVGGTGSFLTFFLSSSGFKCTIYDFDKVESHNTGSQFYGERYIGIYKTKALANTIKNFCEEEINSYNEKYTEKSMVCPLTFSCLDTMEGRKIMFTKWLKVYGNNKHAIFIDGRLLPDDIRVFAIRGGDKLRIKDFLDNRLPADSEVPETVCTYKQTRDSSALLAINMQNKLKNHILNIRQKTNTFFVPYFTEELLPVGIIKTILNP